MTEQKKRRIHNWTQIIAEWKESGKSIKEFCAERNLYKSDFYRVRKKLSQPEPKLIKVQHQSAKPVNNTAPIILETPKNYRIEIGSQFNEETLKKILMLLGTLSCL